MEMTKHIFRVALSTFIAGSLHAESADRVRWHGQAPEAAATSLPDGALLNPNLQYWRDVRFTGVTLACDGRTLPDSGNFGQIWVGGKGGGAISITFPNPCTVREIALKLRGAGGVVVEADAGNPVSRQATMRRALG